MMIVYCGESSWESNGESWGGQSESVVTPCIEIELRQRLMKFSDGVEIS